MEFMQEFNRIMESTSLMAISTSVDNFPNVRIINFYYDSQQEGVVYFATLRNSSKTVEFAENNKLAFITLPSEKGEFVRATKGIVQKSELTIYDLKDAFIRRMPSFKTRIEQSGHLLDVYEIHFKEAGITLGFGKTGIVTF